MLAELDAAELLVTPQRPNPRPLEYNDLHKLMYLNAVLKACIHPFDSACACVKTGRQLSIWGYHFILYRLQNCDYRFLCA